MQGNLVVALRTEALATNLHKLKDRLASNSKRRVNLDKVVRDLQTARVQTDAVSSILRKVETGLDDLKTDHRSSLDPAVRKDLDSLSHLLKDLPDSKTLRNSLQEAIEALNLLSSKCFRMDNGTIGGDIAVELNDRTEPILETVRGLNTKIKCLTSGSSEAAQVWKDLRKASKDQNDKLFSEYIEVLGGVALRDSEFDENIGELAEELLRSYTGTRQKANALAIPVRQQARFLETFKRIIRVSFPDWTVWALPATALEFWQVIEKDKRLPLVKAAVKNLPQEKQNLVVTEESWDFLGDAFATFTMGPAYAMMAITLMLDPADPADNNRVRAILSMLERMDARADGNPPYLDIRIQMYEEWNKAREQDGHEALNLNPREPDKEGKMDPEGIGIRLLIDVFERTLHERTSAEFTPQIWAEAVKWAKPLLRNELEEIKKPQGCELRHVLNAAWLARVHPSRVPEIPPVEPEQTLTMSVERLREKMSK